MVTWVRGVHRHHSGPRMAFRGNLVGNIRSTHSRIPRDLPKPPPMVEVWGDLRFENATKGSRDRPVAGHALFQRGARLLAAPGGVLTRLACKNSNEISTSGPTVYASCRIFIKLPGNVVHFDTVLW